MQIAELRCDGGNQEYRGTYWYSGCGYKLRVPVNERFSWDRCPRCGGKIIIWGIEEE